MKLLACAAGFAQLSKDFELRSRFPLPSNWCEVLRFPERLTGLFDFTTTSAAATIVVPPTTTTTIIIGLAPPSAPPSTPPGIQGYLPVDCFAAGALEASLLNVFDNDFVADAGGFAFAFTADELRVQVVQDPQQSATAPSPFY